ncbi:S-adenosyl-L-methionine-dependent methyltransferase [Chaetomium sp. MPI-SDFR-AT-0129]|nr:S-adenosyl-L-methionine-dependent methyltransferase [Chaetomium sp. MPI-SDFR-AT-0129]
MSDLNQPQVQEQEQEQLPPDLKGRLRDSYNAIAPLYNMWSLAYQGYRMRYTCKLLEFMRKFKQQRHQPPKEHAFIKPTDDGTGYEYKAPNPQHLKGMNALEVGCGSGIPVAEILLAKDMTYFGVDLSVTQINTALQNFQYQTDHLQASWLVGDMMDLSFPPGAMDVIIGFYSLIHLPREEQQVFLKRAWGWLRPGGMLMINFGREELVSEVSEKWLGHEKGWMFWSNWGEDKMMEILEGLGDGDEEGDGGGEGDGGKAEVLLKEITEADGEDPAFVWVIVRKSGGLEPQARHFEFPAE